LLGPSGVGKTLLATTGCEAAGLLQVTLDVTSLSAAGYAGLPAAFVCRQLLEAAQGDLKRAQSGVVILEHIESVRRHQFPQVIRGEAVQQTLLQLLEGGQIPIQVDGRLHAFDISQTLFLALGDSEGLGTARETDDSSGRRAGDPSNGVVTVRDVLAWTGGEE